MSKKSVIARENKRQLLIDQLYKKREELRTLSKKKTLSFEERMCLCVKISSLKRNSSYARKRNRCELTGRPRGYYRKFGVSRIKLRELFSWGYIPGLIKLSW